MLAWASYDFANTIFSAVVLTSFFPLYFTSLSGANWPLGVATTGSMILAGIFMPFLGALSDQTGKTKNYLIKSTLACIFFLIPLSLIPFPTGLIVSFALSCFFYHAALVFYNSLLPVAAAPSQQAFASGLGTGLGYLGVVIAIPVAYAVDRTLGTRWVFITAGILFLICSLPAFFFVPERKVASPLSFHWRLWREEWQKVFRTLRALGAQPHLSLFLSGNFLVVDAMNAAIFWFMVYTREVFGVDKASLFKLLIVVNFSAFLMGIFAGVLTQKIGAWAVLSLSAAALAGTLLGISLSPTFISFAMISTLGGAFAFAGIWTAGRKLLMEWAEPEKCGEYFGLYGLTTKISVIGNLFFSLIADGSGFRAAMKLLIFPAAAGLLLVFLSRWAKPQRD